MENRGTGRGGVWKISGIPVLWCELERSSIAQVYVTRHDHGTSSTMSHRKVWTFLEL